MLINKEEELDSITFSQILTGENKNNRQVSYEEAATFAEEEDLVFLGETSCLEEENNCLEIFYKLLEKVHGIQTELVR